MLITKERTIKKKNSSVCTVYEYPFNNNNLSIATAQITGRYPEKGSAMNTACDEIYFVISGRGKVYLEDNVYHLEKEDALFIKKNQAYYVESKKLTIAIINAPGWNIKQYRLVNTE